MPKRDEIQAAHEAAVLESFIKYQASLGKEMRVVDTPDPPDAIVTIGGKETWIELTNAFLHRRLAESITSYAADDMEHKGLPNGRLQVVEPDKMYGRILEEIILKKYKKRSLKKTYEELGAGILLVGIQNPLSNTCDLIASDGEKLLGAIGSEDSRFNEIFLFSSHRHDFYKLL